MYGVQTIVKSVTRFLDNAEFSWAKLNLNPGKTNQVWVDFNRNRRSLGFVGILGQEVKCTEL